MPDPAVITAVITVGATVRVLPPFDGAMPGNYTVLAIADDEDKTCSLDCGADFASHYLELVDVA